MKANKNVSPGSILAPPADADIDMAWDTAPTGKRYMRSMARLITAWTAVCGTCRPHAWTDWTDLTMNQTRRAPKITSQRAFGPNNHAGTNMPAMANPMATCETSTSRPMAR